MDGPSQVLLKDFMSSAKTAKSKTKSTHTAYVSRINTEHLTKEINKSKLIIGAEITHPNAFKSNPNFLKSLSYLDKSFKTALHNKMKGNSIYIRLENKKMNREARTEFIDRTIKKEYQATMPVIKREDKKPV